MFLGAVAALMLLSLSVPFWRQMLFPPRGCGSGTSACKSNLKNIGTALEMYSSDHGGEYPPSLATLSPEYLKRIPECPLAGQDTARLTGTRARAEAKRWPGWRSCHTRKPKGLLGP